MKKTALLSSILTIVLCLSIIAGSTFALFTDKTEVNVAVTSGNVEVVANLDVAAVYSAAASSTFVDKYLVDEYGHNYYHEEKTVTNNLGTFTNGGTAKIENGELVITNITPGDKVIAQVSVQNVGNVAMKYRYKIVASNTKLADGMVIEVDDTPFDNALAYTSYEATHSYTSPWSGVVTPAENATDVIKHYVSFELPVYAGDEYQSETEDQYNANLEDGFRPAVEHEVKYTITVEAVQGNATMDDDATPYEPIINVFNRDELQIALNENREAGKAYTINVLGKILGDVTVTQYPNVQYTINGNENDFDGSLIVNGRSGADGNVNATLNVNGFNFYSADAITGGAYINFGIKGNTNTRYVRGITIENCIFEGEGFAAIKDQHNGNYDLTVNNCQVLNTEGLMHSFIQLNNFDSVVVNDCNVVAKNGINIGSSETIEVNGGEYNVKGYAVRVGANNKDKVTGEIIPNTDTKYFSVNDAILNVTESTEADDGVIVVRDNAVNCVFTIANTVMNGSNGKILVSMVPELTVFHVTQDAP